MQKIAKISTKSAYFYSTALWADFVAKFVHAWYLIWIEQNSSCLPGEIWLDGVGGQYAPVGIWETRVLKCEPGTGQATKVRHRQGNQGSKPGRQSKVGREGKTVGRNPLWLCLYPASLSLSPWKTNGSRKDWSGPKHMKSDWQDSKKPVPPNPTKMIWPGSDESVRRDKLENWKDCATKSNLLCSRKPRIQPNHEESSEGTPSCENLFMLSDQSGM